MTSVTLLDRVAFYDLAIRETSDTESESLALTSQLSRAESIARSLFLPAKTVSNLKAKSEAGRRASKHTEEASKPSSSTDFSVLLTFSADGGRQHFRRLHVEDSMVSESGDVELVVITPDSATYAANLVALVRRSATSQCTFSRVGVREPLIQIEAKVRANTDGPKIINHLPGPRALSEAKSLFQRNAGLVLVPTDTSLDWSLEISFRDIYIGNVELFDCNNRQCSLKDYFAVIQPYKYCDARPIIEKLIQEMLFPLRNQQLCLFDICVFSGEGRPGCNACSCCSWAQAQYKSIKGRGQKFEAAAK
jgi:hypothetical protein